MGNAASPSPRRNRQTVSLARNSFGYDDHSPSPVNRSKTNQRKSHGSRVKHLSWEDDDERPASPSPPPLSEVEIRVQEIVERLRRQHMLPFDALDEFLALRREGQSASKELELTGDDDTLHEHVLAESEISLLSAYNLGLRAVSHTHLTRTSSGLGLRLVINGFAAMTILSDSWHDGGAFVRHFLEFSVAKWAKVPTSAVIVMQWTPGTNAVNCCLETDTDKWTYKHQLHTRHMLQQRANLIFSVTSKFRNLGRRQRRVHAAVLIQQSWRHFRRRAQDRGDTILSSNPAKEASPVKWESVGAKPHFKGMKHVPTLGEAPEFDHIGLTGTDLKVFGSAFATKLQRHQAGLLTYHDTASGRDIQLTISHAQWIPPRVWALRKSGLDCVSGNPGAENEEMDLEDEFSTMLEAEIRTKSGHIIHATSCVLKLRLLGLAAVTRNDLYCEEFDQLLIQTLQKMANVQADLEWAVLQKAYGSAAITVCMQTAVEL